MSEHAREVDVVVVGGGPAGCAAAIEAAREGALVALVHEGIGGRSLHTQVAFRSLERETSGAARELVREAEWRAMRARARERAKAWSERTRLRLEDAGVELASGHATFVAEREVAAGARRFRAGQIVLALGTEPIALEGLAFDGARVLAPGELIDLPALPRRALVVGGDAGGAEVADLLIGLGVEVTWIMDELGILPSFERELAEGIGDVLMGRGVKLVHGKRALALAEHGPGVRVTLDGNKTYEADLAVVAIGGRAPSFGPVAMEDGWIATDAHGRTTVKSILAVGECTGRTHDVASAEVMGRAIGRLSAGRESEPSDPALFDPARPPRVVFTRPPIAQVGLTPERVRGREVEVRALRFEEGLFGLLAGAGETDQAKGALSVVIDEDGRVAGGTAIGPGAAEIASAIAFAMGQPASRLAHGAMQPSALSLLARAIAG
ncbi:MAG: NAD(P)/FAD-dependent oxidoreductase [Sandaracinaceae bacterium]|nr:NAD(P)/FAD-dependent oxidoreductase [Sandaracinaceae bacterium]